MNNPSIDYLTNPLATNEREPRKHIVGDHNGEMYCMIDRMIDDND